MIIVIGLLIGLALGLTGAGGSLVAVPLLMLFLGMGANEAAGLSLLGVFVGALLGIFPAVLSHVTQSTSTGRILWGPAIILLSAGALFAPVGRFAAHYLPEWFFLPSFVLLSIFIAFTMWRRAEREPANSVQIRASMNVDTKDQATWLCPLSKTGHFQWRPRCVLALLTGGCLVGVLSGLYGVGGGFLIIPLLLFLTGASMPIAIATSLVVICAVSASGFLTWLQWQTSVDTTLLAQLGLGSIIGMVLALLLGRMIAGAKLQKGFAVLVLLLALTTLLSSI